jgi:hypothetical protein
MEEASEQLGVAQTSDGLVLADGAGERQRDARIATRRVRDRLAIDLRQGGKPLFNQFLNQLR